MFLKCTKGWTIRESTKDGKDVYILFLNFTIHRITHMMYVIVRVCTYMK